MPDKIRNQGLNHSLEGQNDTITEDTAGGAQADDPLSRRQRTTHTSSQSENIQVLDPKNLQDRVAKPSLIKRFTNLFKSKKQAELTEPASEEAPSSSTTTSWTPQEKRMLANIAELHEARVEDLMVPRSDVEALDLDTSLAETLKLFEQSGHSRMPVYAETLDDPRGMIHIRDLLNYVTRTSGLCSINAVKTEDNTSSSKTNQQLDKDSELDLETPISKLGIMRDVLFVPVSMPAGRLLARMQASRTQIALVIDEHGGTDGLVSMEDVVEVIVGDIEDEHDDEEADIVKDAQGRWVIDAATELEELKEDLGIDFLTHSQAEAVDTLGGLIVTALDRIPARGEKIEITPQYMVQILEADQRRIKRVRLSQIEPSQSES